MNETFKQWQINLLNKNKYSPILLGMSQQKLEDLFGEASDISTMCSKNGKPRILKYSDIEFHFTDDILRSMSYLYETILAINLHVDLESVKVSIFN